MNQVKSAYYFPCPVYVVERKDLLEQSLEVANQYLESAKSLQTLDKCCPVYASGNFSQDEKAKELISFINQTSWDILDDQGYAMESLGTHCTDLWVQEHFTSSSNPEHVHGFGTQITGFYILEAPENSSKIVIHDPRPAKRQINLPEKDMSQMTSASLAISFIPSPGQLYLMNSYIPHEITRNSSDQPLKFIHFNVSVHNLQLYQNTSTMTQAEVI